MHTMYQSQAWTACVLVSLVMLPLTDDPLLAKCSNSKVCVTDGQATMQGHVTQILRPLYLWHTQFCLEISDYPRILF